MAGRKTIYHTEEEKRVANNARSKKWRDNNMEQYKSITKNQRLKQYGITLDDYNIMLFEQDGCCKICNRHHTSFKNPLSVDHCHSTLKVRGLLCHSCNTILGHSRDDINILKSAINYLK